MPSGTSDNKKAPRGADYTNVRDWARAFRWVRRENQGREPKPLKPQEQE